MNYKKFYKNKKILVTGATGFKGAWLSIWLKILGANVYGIGYKPNKNIKLFDQLKLKNKINFKNIDIRNYRLLNNHIKKFKPEIIFHLAAQPIISKSYDFPLDTYKINSLGTLNLINIIKNYKFTKTAVFITSDKCYESNNSTIGFKENDKLGGIDPYSGSKACAEIIVNTYYHSFFKKNKLIGIATARAGNVIGGGDWSKDRLIPDAIKYLKSSKQIVIRNPNFNRPWQFVLEPLKGYLILAKKQYENPKKYSSAWNFGTNPNSLTDVKTIVEYLIKIWGKGKIKIKKNNFYEQTNLQLNITKAKKILKWMPTYNIKNGVKITTQWYYRVLVEKEIPSIVTEDQIIQYMNDSKIN